MGKITLLVALLCLPLFFAQEAAAQGEGSGSKVLIVYFSHSLNTQKVAQEIGRQTGGDIFRIETKQPYPAAHQDVLDAAEKEKADNARPELKATIDLAPYDTIFLGYPIWWYTLPMPVYSFLDSHDLSGKTLIPFCTHLGSRLSGTEDLLKRLEPGATVLPGLEISGRTITDDPNAAANAPVAAWLQKIGFKK
jgi:flavodoxin